MRPRRPEPHTLAGAYAMDAVAGADKARFERHLASCPACARELAELGEATARLAAAVAAEPPGGLVQRVVASAARTPQLPPAAPGPAGRWRVPRARQPRTARPGRLPAPPRQSLRARLALALAAVFLGAAHGLRRDRAHGRAPARYRRAARPSDRPGADRAGRGHAHRPGQAPGHRHRRDVPPVPLAGAHHRRAAAAARRPPLPAVADGAIRRPVSRTAPSSPSRHDQPGDRHRPGHRRPARPHRRTRRRITPPASTPVLMLNLTT